MIVPYPTLIETKNRIQKRRQEIGLFDHVEESRAVGLDKKIHDFQVKGEGLYK